MSEKTAIYGHERAAREQAAALAKKYSPNLNNLKQVIIDERTSIFIKKDRDSDQAKRNFLARIKNKETHAGGSNRITKQDAAQPPDAWLDSDAD
ncbi:MAG TPA: hypothetical protein P5280_04575 [Cyclobacteriaceae bacterium]|nr:hypothetical protein [Cyclobacteriaceae bacterium]